MVQRALAILLTIATLFELWLLWRDARGSGPWAEDMLFALMYAALAHAAWRERLIVPR